MAKKAVILQYVNLRTLRAGFFAALCRLPGLRGYLNYYQDAIHFEHAAGAGSVQELQIDPVDDYGIGFTEAEASDLLRDKEATPEALKLVYKSGRLRNVAVLGSSGVTVDQRTGKVLSAKVSPGRLSGNWVVARPLVPIRGDRTATYINLLKMRKGHRHFAHFFWDALLPFLVFLKNWHDPDERLIVLVREDLTEIQRDTYRFITEEFANISFQTLAANQKMICDKSIYLASEHEVYGIENTLAREYLHYMADFYLRHYGIAAPSPGPGRRLYLSRQGAAIRRVTNEPEIVAMLSRYGFETIETGSLPFRRQAELLRSADVVVAPCGAALANLMFCRPGTRVLEFFPADYADDCFLKISKALELEYRYVFGGPSVFPKRHYEISVNKLETEIKTLIESGSDINTAPFAPPIRPRRAGE